MYISLKDINQYQLNSLVRELTLFETDYQTKEAIKIPYYYINDSIIEIPRFFPGTILSSIGILGNIVHKKSRIEGYPVNINYKNNFTWRGDNYDFVKKGSDKDVIIIKRPPGKGKTIIGSGIITERKIKTLVLVNMTTLIKQWKDAILTVSDINSDLINENKLFHSKQPASIYISTIQSFTSKINSNGIEWVKQYIKNLGIGLVILDEVHLLVGPGAFTKVLFSLDTRYWVALSATPFKEQERDKILYWWLGKNLIGYSDYDITPTISLIKYYSGIDGKSKKGIIDPYTGEPLKNYYYYINYKRKFFRDRYFKVIIKQKEFLSLLLSICYKSLKAKRQILVITHYNQHGVNIILEELSKHSVFKDKYKSFIGSDTDLKEISKYPIIVTNYKKFSTGVNVPTIDTILMVTPLTRKYELEQAIGRALRLRKDKKKVLIFDIYDESFSERTKKWLDTRMELYKELKFDFY